MQASAKWPELCKPQKITQADVVYTPTEVVQASVKALKKIKGDRAAYLKKILAYMKKNKVPFSQAFQGGQREINRILKDGYRFEIKKAWDAVDTHKRWGGVPPDIIDRLKKYRSLLFPKRKHNFARLFKAWGISRSLRTAKFRAQGVQKTCTPVNQAEKLGAVRDQGGADWCVHFTMADLLSHKLGQRVSASDLAFQINRVSGPLAGDRYKKAEYRVGFVLAQLVQALFIRDQKEYDQPHLRASPESLANMGFLLNSSAQILKKVNGLCTENKFSSNDFNKIRFVCMMKVITDSFRKRKDNPNHVCRLIYATKQLFPQLKEKEFKSALAASTARKFVDSLRDSQCSEKAIPASQLSSIKPKSFHRTDYTKKTMMKELDKKLSQGGIVSIAYNTHIFRKRYAEGAAGSAGHASNIVGRRFNKKTGQCEYLLRNSWGHSWKPNKESDVKPSKKYPGHAWVSKTTLANNVLVMTMLE